ncbi:MAG: magnesium transporter CorA family protein [Gammaproteobacteria bacterium]
MIQRYALSGGELQPVDTERAPIEICINPDEAERRRIKDEFHLDDHELTSALDPDEVSRLEIHGDHLLVIWKQPRNYSVEDAFFFDVGSLGLVLAGERLLILATEQPTLGGLTPRPAAPPGTAFEVVLRLLLNSVHHYLGHLKVIKMIARELQQKINTSLENEHLIRMFNLSESLVFFVNAIHSNGAVLARLRNHAERQGMPAPIVAALEDLVIENNQCYKQAEIYSNVYSALMDARGNLVNNNMNVLLRNLTVINVVFLPLNLIASIGGMSEFSMMTAGIDWRISYSLFCAAMVAVGWLTAVLLRRVYVAAPSRRSRAPERAGGA